MSPPEGGHYRRKHDTGSSGCKEGNAQLGVTLLVRDIRTEADLATAFDAGVREHVDGLLLTAESILCSPR